MTKDARLRFEEYLDKGGWVIVAGYNFLRSEILKLYPLGYAEAYKKWLIDDIRIRGKKHG